MPFIVPTQRIEDFQYQIQVFGERAEELEPVLNNILDKILARNKRAYESRGATTGRFWAPLRGSTVERKKRDTRIVDPFAPLRETDALMDSLSRRGAPHQHIEVDDEGLYLATTLPYAELHQTGTKNMPARPPMTIPAKHAQEYIKDLNDFIFEEGA